MSELHKADSSRRPSRRQFLARSTALAGTAMAGSLSIARSAHAAGSDGLKIGLIGCGGRGGGAVHSALSVDPGAKLTAMADPFADRMMNARKRLKTRLKDQIAVDDDHCFSDFYGYRELLESGVDVAILTEPPHFRPMHVEACVDAGVHAFVEKPMAVDAPGVRKVLAAGQKARQKNISFVSGFETRYGGTREAISRLRDGQIGDVVSIHTAYNTGPLWHRGREDDWTEMQFQMRNWYYFTWLSGDHIVEQHVHYNDLVGWVMQDQPPQSAWGYGGRQVRTEAKWGDIFDHHAVVYEYPNGVHYFAFTRQQPGCFNGHSKVVFGTKGQLKSERGWTITDLGGKTVWTARRQQKNAEINCFEEMFAAMKQGKPINDGLSMARSTMSAILGRMATHSGQRVTWDEAYNSDLVLAPKSYAWDADPPVMPGPDGKYPQPMPGVTKVL